MTTKIYIFHEWVVKIFYIAAYILVNIQCINFKFQYVFVIHYQICVMEHLVVNSDCCKQKTNENNYFFLKQTFK